MTKHRLTRRTFLKATAAGATVAGFPLPLRAQPKTFKIGVIHPVTGALAEPGQACRLGAQMAADAINAAGGITSKGGIKLELIVGDTQTKPENGRVEAERVVNQGAQMLMGSFDSGSTSAMVSVAQQKRVPFLIDIAAADPITANVAKSVRDGEQSQARGLRAAHKAANPTWEIVEVIPWPEPPSDLSTEVSRAKAAKPVVIAPITRPASALLLLPEIAKQRIELMGIVSPGSPGLYEAGQLAALKEDLEYVLTSVPWVNFKNPKTPAVADEYRRRSGGKTFDTNSGYSYDAVFVIADVLERAARLDDPDAIVEALKTTDYAAGLMQYGGPIHFNEVGDNQNAIPTMIQILGQRPVAVWPKEAALQKFVFPRPKA